MTHLLRVVNQPVQSQHNKQNKQVTGSQPLKQHWKTRSYLPRAELKNDNVQGFDTKWDEVLLSMEIFR